MGKPLSYRHKILKKNFTKVFWVKALMNLKMLNVVLSIFYIARGINYSQIFYLVAIFSVINLFFEVPSSWWADKWGRKNTLILGVFFSIMYWVVYFFAHSFGMFALGTFFFALSYACLSGTDEALIYDTSKEIGDEKNALSKLGLYHSAERLFKIITPMIAVFVAHNLTDLQFSLLILVDIIATTCALLLSFSLVEPNHYMDMEKIEQGVFRDAFSLITSNKLFMKAILSKMLVFSMSLMLWSYFQSMFISIGVSVTVLGIGWGLHHIFPFLGNYFAGRIFKTSSLEKIINFSNIFCVVSVGLFVICWWYFRNPYILFFLYILFCIFQSIRDPYYSQFFNRVARSYNRATTISLTHFLKDILDTPLMLLAAYVITLGIIYPYYIAFVVCFLVVIFTFLPTKDAVE